MKQREEVGSPRVIRMRRISVGDNKEKIQKGRISEQGML